MTACSRESRPKLSLGQEKSLDFGEKAVRPREDGPIRDGLRVPVSREVAHSVWSTGFRRFVAFGRLFLLLRYMRD
jgi:hypothetical protein